MAKIEYLSIFFAAQKANDNAEPPITLKSLQTITGSRIEKLIKPFELGIEVGFEIDSYAEVTFTQAATGKLHILGHLYRLYENSSMIAAFFEREEYKDRWQSTLETLLKILTLETIQETTASPVRQVFGWYLAQKYAASYDAGYVDPSLYKEVEECGIQNLRPCNTDHFYHPDNLISF